MWADLAFNLQQLLRDRPMQEFRLHQLLSSEPVREIVTMLLPAVLVELIGPLRHPLVQLFVTYGEWGRW